MVDALVQGKDSLHRVAELGYSKNRDGGHARTVDAVDAAAAAAGTVVAAAAAAVAVAGTVQ